MWQLKATHGFYKAIISTNLNPVKIKQQEIIPLIGLSVIFISLTAFCRHHERQVSRDVKWVIFQLCSGPLLFPSYWLHRCWLGALISRPASSRGACTSGGEAISTRTDVQDAGWAAGTLGYDFKSCPSTQRASIWDYAESSIENRKLDIELACSKNVFERKTWVIQLFACIEGTESNTAHF